MQQIQLSKPNNINNRNTVRQLILIGTQSNKLAQVTLDATNAESDVCLKHIFDFFFIATRS